MAMMFQLSKLFVILQFIFVLHQSTLVDGTVFSCNSALGCGCSLNDVNINARIVGGEVAASHSWGWAVALRNYRGNTICGGTILSSSYILTAAHCVDDSSSYPNLFSVMVGADSLTSTEGVVYQLSKIYVHPAYNSRTKENDIAILYLSRPMSFGNRNLARMCLPAVNSTEQSRYPKTDRPIVAIGWGTTSSGGSSLSNSLRQVTVNTVDSDDNTCKDTINNKRLQFCAAVRGGGKDTCQGDSGGPIMYYSSNEQVWVLAGVTSYGRGCGLSNYAGVYTRVSVYLSWIKSITGDDNIITVAQSAAHLHLLSNLMMSVSLCLIMLTNVLKY